MEYEELQERYGREAFYWGTEENAFAHTAAEHLPENGTIVDIGAGEGRDAVFFAEQGFDVLAVGIAPNGSKKRTDSPQSGYSTANPEPGSPREFHGVADRDTERRLASTPIHGEFHVLVTPHSNEGFADSDPCVRPHDRH
jgi:hypothetical protein